MTDPHLTLVPDDDSEPLVDTERGEAHIAKMTQTMKQDNEIEVVQSLCERLANRSRLAERVCEDVHEVSEP